MQNIETFETARLTAARVAQSDFPDLRALWQDSRVMATLGGVRPEQLCRDQLSMAIDHWTEFGFGMWVLREKPSDLGIGQVIGHVSLRHWLLDGLPEIDLGYSLRSDCWGKGLATEATQAVLELGFARLGCEHITAIALPDNLASHRVLEKIGFQYHRDVVFRNLLHGLYRLKRPRTHQP